MGNNEQVKIADWVKMNSSVTKVADDLNLSRPTVYTYMEAYDKGDKDLIPEEVVAYFDKMVFDSDSITTLQVKLKLKEEILMLNDKAAEISYRLKEMMEVSAEYESRLVELKSVDGDSREALLLMEKLSQLKKETSTLSVNYENIQDRIEHLSRELAFYEQAKVLPSSSKKLYKIQSKCYFEDKKCMVIYNGEHCEDSEYRLYLYAKLDSDYVFLKYYTDKEMWNYFIIDDVLFSAPLYYEICRCSYDGSVDFDGTPIMTPDKDETTGMCELKQRK